MENFRFHVFITLLYCTVIFLAGILGCVCVWSFDGLIYLSYEYTACAKAASFWGINVIETFLEKNVRRLDFLN